MSKQKPPIDISVPISSDLPVWPDAESPNITTNKSLETDGVRDSSINLNLHTGTHIDAPSHLLKHGQTIADMPVSKFENTVRVVFLPDAEVIQPDHIHTKNENNIDGLLFKTRNKHFFPEASSFRKDYTALQPAAAREYVEEGYSIVGIDYLSIEPYEDTGNTHQILFNNNVLIAEGLNLRSVPPGVYSFLLLPILIENAEAAPARAILNRKVQS